MNEAGAKSALAEHNVNRVQRKFFLLVLFILYATPLSLRVDLLQAAEPQDTNESGRCGAPGVVPAAANHTGTRRANKSMTNGRR